MVHAKGASAPFFFALAVPRLRDDAQLAHALEAFKAGDHAAALIAVEYVCRRLPHQGIAAMLRAKIIETCRPQFGAKAWYQAWCCDPENPALQDSLLRSWLANGARASVAELGPAFLPARCRDGLHASLLPLLAQAGVNTLGACWKAGERIEGMVFLPAAADGAVPRASLLLSDETRQYQYEVPADGRRFRLDCPRPGGVWSLALATAPRQPLPGSPLAFYPQPGAPLALSAPPAEAKASRDGHSDIAGTVIPTQAGTHATPAPRFTRPPIAVVIPVYRDQALVQACIASVLASLPHNRARVELVVIDDASPEPALSAWLAGQASAGHLTLLRNHVNLGFIETVNRGMRHHARHDVLLLNADTLVHGDWIDRLARALYEAPDIGSVTPWSNNGEISSFPRIAYAAPAPTAEQLARLDGAAAAVRAAGASTDIELPSCCGFTMLIRRDALDRTGLLDGAGLVRGYGEEVDWCLRARAAGYRHLAATGVFVAHTGTVSFRFEKNLRVRQNRNMLVARYPEYYAEYHRFLRNDPLKAGRAALRDALEHGHDDWLRTALHLSEGRTELAAAVPAAILSHTLRIAVWQHQPTSPAAPAVLALARLIASRPDLTLRLLIIGAVNESLWHTGVVDVLPSNIGIDGALLTDATMVGLCACAALLTDGAKPAPGGVPLYEMGPGFDARAWLDDWLARQAAPVQQPYGVTEA